MRVRRAARTQDHARRVFQGRIVKVRTPLHHASMWLTDTMIRESRSPTRHSRSSSVGGRRSRRLPGSIGRTSLSPVLLPHTSPTSFLLLSSLRTLLSHLFPRLVLSSALGGRLRTRRRRCGPICRGGRRCTRTSATSSALDPATVRDPWRASNPPLSLSRWRMSSRLRSRSRWRRSTPLLSFTRRRCPTSAAPSPRNSTSLSPPLGPHLPSLSLPLGPHPTSLSLPLGPYRLRERLLPLGLGSARFALPSPLSPLDPVLRSLG